jgi:hypothetical protein
VLRYLTFGTKISKFEQEAGSEKPSTGSEIKNDRLAAALQQKVEFTKEEWQQLQAADLSSDCYIKAGNRYFKPAPGRAVC